MTNTVTTNSFLQRDASWRTNEDIDMMRGRTRDRSLTRANVGKALRPDESSTLRGRSRQRAASPRGLTSRNASPSIGNILHYRLQGSARREHCPSRPANSPSNRRQSSPRRRQQRARSRSRNAARTNVETLMLDVQQHQQQQHQQYSGLRNEVLPEEAAEQQETPFVDQQYRQ